MYMSLQVHVVSYKYDTTGRHLWSSAEDTFILLDALEEDADDLRKMCPAVCVEIGCVCRFSSSLIVLKTRIVAARDASVHSLAKLSAPQPHVWTPHPEKSLLLTLA